MEGENGEQMPSYFLYTCMKFSKMNKNKEMDNLRYIHSQKNFSIATYKDTNSQQGMILQIGRPVK